MESWNIEGVCDFLVKYEFDEDVVQIFRMNKISGSVLVLLNDADMKELGVAALGDRTEPRGQFLNKEESPAVHVSASKSTTEMVRQAICI